MKDLKLTIECDRKFVRVQGGRDDWHMIDISSYTHNRTKETIKAFPIELLEECIKENDGKFLYVWTDISIYQISENILFVCTYPDAYGHYKYLKEYLKNKGIDDNLAWRNYGNFSDFEKDGIGTEFIPKNDIGWVVMDIDFSTARCLTKTDCLGVRK